VILTAAAEPWPRLALDPSLPDLFVAYGDEFDYNCDPDWALAHRQWAAHDLYAHSLRNEDRLLVGFCVCEIRRRIEAKGQAFAEARLIYVSPAYRGLGTQILLDNIAQCMRAVGAEALVVHHGKGALMRVWIRRL
jgi:GNAT superfamily N-acetyltransferase